MQWAGSDIVDIAGMGLGAIGAGIMGMGPKNAPGILDQSYAQWKANQPMYYQSPSSPEQTRSRIDLANRYAGATPLGLVVAQMMAKKGGNTPELLDALNQYRQRLDMKNQWMKKNLQTNPEDYTGMFRSYSDINRAKQGGGTRSSGGSGVGNALAQMFKNDPYGIIVPGNPMYTRGMHG